MQEGGRSEAGTRNKGPERTSPGPLWRFPGFTGCSDQQMAACPPDLVHPLGLESALTLPVQCWRSFNTPIQSFCLVSREKIISLCSCTAATFPACQDWGSQCKYNFSAQTNMLETPQHVLPKAVSRLLSPWPHAHPPPPKALGHLLAEMRPTLQANKER